MHPLFGFEAREHTAQVDGEKRAVREKRFRFGEKEQSELAAADKRLRELGEANRFLPVLFCSPTMELGVDISALNAVYVFRDIELALYGAVERSLAEGRSVPLPELPGNHRAVQASIVKLLGQYREVPQVAFLLLHNTGAKDVEGNSLFFAEEELAPEGGAPLLSTI